jgi:trimethylamine--corrinoid protein Co-methyltransferase
MVAAYLEPIVVDEATLAHEAIGEVGPAGHFFGVQHTQDRFRDAFYKPLISDWRNYESWEEAGKPTADQKAKELAQVFLDEYQRPEMDAATYEELDAFRKRRVAEGGVATDF